MFLNFGKVRYFFLFAFIAVSVVLPDPLAVSAVSPMPLSRRRVAILYWGMARASELVFESHERLLRAPLREANLDADVLMHTWRVNAGEPVLVWGKDTGARSTGDEHLRLHPDVVLTDDQQGY